MRTSIFLAIASGIAVASAADCAAPGDYDAQGRYSCNPAHQYPAPNGCKVIDGCPLLVDGNGKPIVKTTTTTTSSAPTPTASCAGPGEYDAKGRYSCNLAHQYPAPNSCKVVDGCPVLVDGDGKPIIKPTTTTTSAQPTTTCAAPGDRDSKGRYSCNPAHQYPEGQQCVLQDGCYVLVSGGTKTTSMGPNPTGKTCPAAGTTDSQGRYSCNPAHQYPNGQTCVVIDGCYVLCDAGGKPIDNGGHTTGTPVPIANGASSAMGSVMAVVAAAAAFL